MEAFVNQGHNVLLLTHAPRGAYHERCEQLGVKVHSHVIGKRSPIIYYLRHSLHLFLFCRRNKVDIIYAHLETAALPAVLIQYFVQARVIACRHIIDEAVLSGNRNFIRIVRLVYRMARQVIVVSERAKLYMVEREKVAQEKITVIRLAYNFGLYASPESREVKVIRESHACELLLITACRLVPAKRPEFSIQIVENLIKLGLDVKLMLLGTGPAIETLTALINTKGLGHRVFLLGHRSNIMDYLSAADMLVHPSILDSSSVIIKEAGLREKLVVACRDIGDVNEYLVHGENSFLVSADQAVSEMTGIIHQVYEDRKAYDGMGEALKVIVQDRFSIERILPSYDEFHNA